MLGVLFLLVSLNYSSRLAFEDAFYLVRFVTSFESIGGPSVVCGDGESVGVSCRVNAPAVEIRELFSFSQHQRIGFILLSNAVGENGEVKFRM